MDPDRPVHVRSYSCFWPDSHVIARRAASRGAIPRHLRQAPHHQNDAPRHAPMHPPRHRLTAPVLSAKCPHFGQTRKPFCVRGIGVSKMISHPDETARSSDECRSKTFSLYISTPRFALSDGGPDDQILPLLFGDPARELRGQKMM